MVDSSAVWRWWTSWVGPVAFATLVALTLASSGCGDDILPADGGPDASVDAGANDAGALRVTPPDIPWLADGVPPIALTPCPEGWREVDGAVATCDPYPEGGAETCDIGEAHFPGEPGCRPIGDACPSGDYAAAVPSAGPVVYVKAGAPSGGDGTRATPFAALGEVPWVSLSPGVTVALGKGTYAGTLPLKAGVTVVGACVAETVITGLAAPVPSVVSVTQAGEPAVVANLSIRDAPQRGVTLLGGRSLMLRGVLIDGARGLGVLAGGAARLSLGDVVIRGTVQSPTLAVESGIGAWVVEGALLEANRLIAEGNRGIGVFVGGEGSEVLLADAVVRDTRMRDVTQDEGQGLYVETGGRLEATRVLVSGNRTVGVFATGMNASLELNQVVIRDTESRAFDALLGRGLSLQEGAECAASRLLVTRNRDAGVFASGVGTAATLTDVVITDTATAAAGNDVSAGRGVGAQNGARLDAVRLLTSGNAESGLYVSNADTVVSLADVAIRDMAPDTATVGRGRGVSAQHGARLMASRLLIADSYTAGLVASDEATLVSLSDVVVRDTRAQLGDRRFGQGMQAQLGARIEGQRVRVDRSLEDGVVAVSGATVVLSDAAIRGVEPADCASTSCSDVAYGYGVGAVGASVSLTRFLVDDAAVCGVLVATRQGRSAGLDLESGVVSGSQIGACVQVDAYDVNRLSHDVEYQDNGTNLDSTMLPIPGELGSL